MADRSAAEYAVYGVLCAAKLETGPGGARRFARIQEALDFEFTENEIGTALRDLISLGWVRELDEVLGMVHFEAVQPALVSDG